MVNRKWIHSSLHWKVKYNFLEKHSSAHSFSNAPWTLCASRLCGEFNGMQCYFFFLSSVSNIYPATATEICTKFYHHSHNENLNGCAVCRFACHGPCSTVRAGVCAIWKLRNECKMHILCNKFIKSKKILFATPLNSNPLPRRERHGGEIKRSAKGNYYRIYVC